jgi:hypothetical protein
MKSGTVYNPYAVHRIPEDLWQSVECLLSRHCLCIPYNTISDTGNVLNAHSRSEAGLKAMTLVQGLKQQQQLQTLI